MTTPLPIISSDPNKKRTGKFKIFIFAIVAIIIGWYIVLGIGVYGGYWQGAKTRAVLKWTPLPVAMVNWRPLSYGTYLEQKAAVAHYTTYLASTTSGVYQSSGDNGAVALTKMIRLSVSQSSLKKFNIAVTAADVNQAYQAQLLQNGNADQVKATIKSLYGWTPEQFKAYVVRPAIIRDKLQNKLSFDEKLSAAAKKQADTVLTLVNAGSQSFGDLAKKYSEDDYGVNGGDLGWVNRGEQAKEIDDVAFSLDINAVSDLIHTQYGFHIIKPLERKTVDGVDQVHLLMITILAPQVDPYLNDQLIKMTIAILAPKMKWDKTNAQISVAK